MNTPGMVKWSVGWRMEDKGEDLDSILAASPGIGTATDGYSSLGALVVLPVLPPLMPSLELLLMPR
jgi:hypothetical protein